MFISLFCSCQQGDKTIEYAAKVYDSHLTKEEVASFIPVGTTPEDSLLMAESYIRGWVSQRLMLHLAHVNLSDSVKRAINKQVNEYKTSLLIHQYKQEYINKKLEINISDSEVEAFYNANKENFLLATPVVKALFIILPKSEDNSKTIKEINKLFYSSKQADSIKLEEMSTMVAKKYDNFNDNWIEVKYILSLIPGDVRELERAITNNKYIEKEDENNYYLLRIDHIKHEQTIAPLDYVRDEIRLILENQHKVNFEYEFENQINLDGRKTQNVIIY